MLYFNQPNKLIGSLDMDHLSASVVPEKHSQEEHAAVIED